MSELHRLVAEAVALGGGNLCASGHDWKSEGGRPCPRDPDANCSQTVYRCTRCPEWDYGEAGGPAHRECYEPGPCSRSCGDDET